MGLKSKLTLSYEHRHHSTCERGRRLGALRGFLGALLESQIVDALLVPLEIGQGRSLAQTLVQDPAYLSGANPLSPVMPVNSATLVSQLTADKPTQKVGVVLRSCEIRALVELVKLQQANLDNLTIIGVDCLGTYEVDDYARLIGFIMGNVYLGEFGIPETTASLDTIGVHPDYQGQGLAIELMNEFVRNLEKAGVERIYTLINWNDWDLLRFFEKSGFVPAKMVNLELQIT